MFMASYLKHIIWAPSSEFVSSSIPSWQISTAHAQPFRGARDLAFYLKVPLDSLLIWASSGGSGKTVRMCRLAWTFAARIGDKYQIRLTRSIYTSSNNYSYLCYYNVPFMFYEKTTPNFHKTRPEDHWSCIAHLSAEDMLKSEEKKDKNIESDWFGPRSVNDLDLWYSKSLVYSF